VVGAHLETDDGVDLGRLGRDHHDRHPRPVANLPAHVDTRHPGQHHIEEHEVGPAGVEDFERLQPVARHLHPKALPLEADHQGLDERLLVLDNKNRGLFCHPASASVQPETATGPGPAGRRSWKIDPSPSRDVTDTLPPWLVATWRTMARPSPVPPVSLLRARSTR